MSDDEDDKGKKTNASPEHTPKNVGRKDISPTGTVGRKPAGLSLGGGSARRQATHVADQVQSDTAERPYDPEKPIAIATGNREQDSELAKDHNVITREKAEQMMGKEKVSQAFYDEPSRDADQAQDKGISRDDQRQELAEKKAEGPRISQSEFAKAFRQAAQRDNAMRQTPKRGLE